MPQKCFLSPWAPGQWCLILESNRTSLQQGQGVNICFKRYRRLKFTVTGFLHVFSPFFAQAWWQDLLLLSPVFGTVSMTAELLLSFAARPSVDEPVLHYSIKPYFLLLGWCRLSSPLVLNQSIYPDFTRIDSHCRDSGMLQYLSTDRQAPWKLQNGVSMRPPDLFQMLLLISLFLMNLIFKLFDIRL